MRPFFKLPTVIFAHVLSLAAWLLWRVGRIIANITERAYRSGVSGQRSTLLALRAGSCFDRAAISLIRRGIAQRRKKGIRS